ncbi:MAG: hypothetical protein DRN01_06405 [Thermoplasmata archaeon]|nr:MAG: hypothetical protein DRN01_06405 [Thermoplasmata archaeon]
MAVGKRVQIGDVVNITAAADLTGGEVVAFGSRGGVVAADALTGEIAAVQIEGVFQFTAATADTISFGDPLYYVAGEATITFGGITLGKAVTEKAGAVAGTVNVKLEESGV